MVQIRSTSLALSLIGAMITSYAVYILIPGNGWVTLSRDGVTHWLLSVLMIILGVIMFSIGFTLVIAGGSFVEPRLQGEEHIADIIRMEPSEEWNLQDDIRFQ